MYSLLSLMMIVSIVYKMNAIKILSFHTYMYVHSVNCVHIGNKPLAAPAA